MHVIYLYLVLALFVLWIVQQTGKLKKIYIVIASCAILAAVLALRNAEFGVVDSIRYSIYYDDISYTHNFMEALMHSNGKDIGYWGFCYIFASLGFSYQQFVSIMSIFIIGSFSWYINKYSHNPVLSCFILLGSGCFTFLFYGLRQAMAFPFILFCVDACYNKKIIKTVCYALTAFLFHWSSVAIIPLLILSRVRFNKLTVLGYSFSLIFMMLFSTQIGYLLTILFREEYEGTYVSSGDIGGLGLLYLIVLFWYVFILKNKIFKSLYYSFFLHGLIILCMIQICSAYAYSFTRLNYFYMLAIMTIACPASFNSENLKSFFGWKSSKAASTLVSITYMILMVILFNSFIRGNNLNDFIFYWE